ncbi:hypothetical protein [Roseimaritima multifibrata]|uniref:hypothetical protein n=1 Tax=Roseimaritima multifibrata TaxID=1930274 RepID=UPI0011A91119|nr:hypothetical protein [Roseimaritima multifibrata]
MNRRRTNTTARIFAAFAVIAVLLVASPAVRAGQPCPEACCQSQHVAHDCCGENPSHECPAMASCDAPVWLPPRTSGAESASSGSLHSDFAIVDWKMDSVAFVDPVRFPRSNSLIEQHVRLQI